MSNIREHHGGIEQLRSAFSAAALGTFTNGWVWFVSDQVGHTATMTTYGPSTLLIRARTHMELENNLSINPRLPSNTHPGVPQIPPHLPDSDMPLVSSSADDLNSDASFMSTAPASIHRDGGSTHPAKSSKGRDLISGEILYPLFCLPVYEHTWMSAGYGVWGKEQWLKEFWSVLDWRRVNGIYENITNKDRNTSYI
jgi:Fe-Mn family superoxide dismutase